MKRKFLNVFVMSILLVVVLACDSLNSSESLLLGKWKNVILDDNVKVESITEYKKDRTFCSSMKVEIVANLNDAEIVDTLDIQEFDNIGDLVPPVAVFWYRRFTLSDFSYRLSGTAPESVL